MLAYASPLDSSRRWSAVTCPALVLLLAQIAVCAENVTVTGKVRLVNPSARRRIPDSSNAVMWLVPLSESARARQQHAGRTPRQPPRVRQKNKRFDPHLLVVPIGTVVEFPNLDPFFHNVFSLFEGKRFDLGLYEAGTTRSVHFNKPGICYIFCNIHPEMSAVVVVLDTPYFGVSGRNGEIRIPDVPPGRYELHIWHERVPPEVLKNLSRQITIAPDSSTLGSITLTESADLLAQHKNKYERDYDKATPSSPVYEQP